MAKTTITKAEYLQLVGLCALRQRINDQEVEIDHTVAALLGEPRDGGKWPYYGHISDILGERVPDADAMLQKLGITVADAMLQKLGITVADAMLQKLGITVADAPAEGSGT